MFWLIEDPAEVVRVQKAQHAALASKFLLAMNQEHWVQDSPARYHRLKRINRQVLAGIHLGADEAAILLGAVPVHLLQRADTIVVPDSIGLTSEAIQTGYNVQAERMAEVVRIESDEDLSDGFSKRKILLVDLYRETGVTLFLWIEHLRNKGAEVLASVVFLDCSTWTHLPYKLYSVASRPITRYAARDCPFCLKHRKA